MYVFVLFLYLYACIHFFLHYYHQHHHHIYHHSFPFSLWTGIVKKAENAKVYIHNHLSIAYLLYLRIQLSYQFIITIYHIYPSIISTTSLHNNYMNQLLSLQTIRWLYLVVVLKLLLLKRKVILMRTMNYHHHHIYHHA